MDLNFRNSCIIYMFLFMELNQIQQNIHIELVNQHKRLVTHFHFTKSEGHIQRSIHYIEVELQMILPIK